MAARDLPPICPKTVRNELIEAVSGCTPVKIVYISDPSDPFVVAELAGPDRGCSLQDVKVETINTKFFKGDLLAVGGEGCFAGLQLWDVSDPTNPNC